MYTDRTDNRKISRSVDLSVRSSLTRVRHLAVGQLRPYPVMCALQITWQKSIRCVAFQATCSSRETCGAARRHGNGARADRCHRRHCEFVWSASFKQSPIITIFSEIVLNLVRSNEKRSENSSSFCWLKNRLSCMFDWCRQARPSEIKSLRIFYTYLTSILLALFCLLSRATGLIDRKICYSVVEWKYFSE